MAKVRHKNSRAELTVFSYLRKNKIYFQKHYKKAPGNPDIALPRKKLAVFIDGDYWHGRYPGKITKTDFWTSKINGNIERDKKVMHDLKQSGWSVLRIWESDINRLKTRYGKLLEIKEFLKRS